jgi:hypothetical protein
LANAAFDVRIKSHIGALGDPSQFLRQRARLEAQRFVIRFLQANCKLDP